MTMADQAGGFVTTSVLEQLEILLANTNETRRAVHRLRFDVYCEELGFENPRQFPDRLEYDACDAWSSHYLIRTKRDQESVGTVRIVHADPALGHLSPMHRLYGEETGNRPEHLQPHTRFCELSRLTIARKYRRRIADQSQMSHAVCSLIAPLLYLTVAHHLLTQNAHDRAYAMLEPRLGAHINRIGFPLARIGEVVNYHGQRAPFGVTVAHLRQYMSPSFRSSYQAISGHIKRADVLEYERQRLLRAKQRSLRKLMA